MIDVALVRCQELPEPDSDMDLLQESLAARGLSVAWRSWDGVGEHGRFDDARIAVVRAAWNYFLDYAAFRAWIDRTARVTRLYNEPRVLAWNSDKSYLGELVEKGVAVVPTVYVARGEAPDLAGTMRARGWSRVVVKPRVSAGSFETYQYALADVDASTMQKHTLARDMMVQPFVASVDDYGERALVFIDGELTHAVRKMPRFANGVERTDLVPVADDEAAFAKAVLSCVPEKLLYARVDLARDERGAPMLMELEACEPSLHLWRNETALARFCDAIAREVRA